MFFLSDDQVRRIVKVDDVISVIRAAFARGFSTLRMPVRTTMQMDGSVLLIMPCYDSALNAAGVKLVSVSKKARVQGVYELLDPSTGIPVARMEANYLTDIRTAATSAVATDILARHDVETLGIFGSGRQAISHLTALPRVRRFRRFLVCGSGRSNLQTFCGRVKAELGIHLEPVDASTCARESDVLCTCTNAGTPLFNGSDLRPGTHLNLVGSFRPETREVDDTAVARARVVVDVYDAALEEAGDVMIPIKNKTIDLTHVLADLHEIASGKKEIRTHRDDITLFKSVGCALEDLVTAQSVYRLAEQKSGLL